MFCCCSALCPRQIPLWLNKVCGDLKNSLKCRKLAQLGMLRKLWIKQKESVYCSSIQLSLQPHITTHQCVFMIGLYECEDTGKAWKHKAPASHKVPEWMEQTMSPDCPSQTGSDGLSVWVSFWRRWCLAYCTMMTFKHFMKIEVPNGFVKPTENSFCHFGLEKAICCPKDAVAGFFMQFSLRHFFHRTHWNQYLLNGLWWQYSVECCSYPWDSSILPSLNCTFTVKSMIICYWLRGGGAGSSF